MWLFAPWPCAVSLFFWWLARLGLATYSRWLTGWLTVVKAQHWQWQDPSRVEHYHRTVTGWFGGGKAQGGFASSSTASFVAAGRAGRAVLQVQYGYVALAVPSGMPPFLWFPAHNKLQTWPTSSILRLAGRARARASPQTMQTACFAGLALGLFPDFRCKTHSLTRICMHRIPRPHRGLLPSWRSGQGTR